MAAFKAEASLAPAAVGASAASSVRASSGAPPVSTSPGAIAGALQDAQGQGQSEPLGQGTHEPSRDSSPATNRGTLDGEATGGAAAAMALDDTVTAPHRASKCQ